MTNITPADVATHIAEARKGAGISVAHLSETTGIADKTLRRRLRAPEQLTLGELSAIATATGTSLEALIEGGAALAEGHAA